MSAKPALFPAYNAGTKSIDFIKNLTPDGIGKVLTNRVKQLGDAHIIPPIANPSSHSLRRGGATHLHQQCMPDWLIKQMGCWNSDVFKLYTDHSWRQLLTKLHTAFS
jgi:hypothetical protein